MQDVTRNSYSLYKRDVGNRTVWYARFWSDDTQSYTSGRSTGQTTKAAAHRQVQKWLTDGLPDAAKKDQKATKNRLVGAITKYLEDCDVIKKGEQHETSDILKLFYSQVTDQEMSSGEKLIDYLYRFWDWEGDYVQGKLERGKSIGKKYVEDCRTKTRLHIEPYFKDTLLCDVTTQSLEAFMRSFPRREVDPKNGISRRTINLIMTVKKKPLKEAVRVGLLSKNPADTIELLSENTKQKGILSPTELQQLFRLDRPDERSRVASILAAVSAMRLSEIVGLRIENIAVERNMIHVQQSYSSFEKRLKGTKTEKPRVIYTDATIIQMLVKLHGKNPHGGSFIFWGLEPTKPIRYETIEAHLERVLAKLLGEAAKKVINAEWQEIAAVLAEKTGIQSGEMMALCTENLDTMQNCVCIRCAYSFTGKRVTTVYRDRELTVSLDATLMQRLSALCGKDPYVFPFYAAEKGKPFDFDAMGDVEAKRMTEIMGEVIRRERNVTFHSFRHFVNSTLRGSVSDDILRLQTGHSNEKMTDWYDHMTDDRGEQLRKAVQTKIMPFIS